jgi:hypothetical protein
MRRKQWRVGASQRIHTSGGADLLIAAYLRNLRNLWIPFLPRIRRAIFYCQHPYEEYDEQQTAISNQQESGDK